MAELAALFLASFTAATLIPLPSEAALFAYLKAFPENTALAVAVATVGNTLGGMTTYFLGRFFPVERLNTRYVPFLRKNGAVGLLLAWTPVIGDALCLAAGWLRVNWVAALCFMAAGRLARYVVVASFA